MILLHPLTSSVPGLRPVRHGVRPELLPELPAAAEPECVCVGVCVCVEQQLAGGFAWDGSALQFNWHPVLMNKLPWKLLHAGLMLLALIFSIVGLCAVFDFHNKNKTPNLYSLHSWIGIAATALFALQWVFGAGVFLLPCAPPSLRGLLKPLHPLLQEENE
ncbi:hypothetical protein F7725_012193 [Dissostichus mawsoni]|uniref:Lysosomal membrane ascorbate-dependent ferrireductase CYB561A3 n=1 Tax=Dissostichus mawsoni TaxID=36200 RepID=A0A7J5YNA3_DISMA|nr:hypothetical protein F7725_012193 [Dissostichus mawsoni]